MERAFSIFVVVSMTVIGVALCDRLQCKDSNGKPVDWYLQMFDTDNVETPVQAVHCCLSALISVFTAIKLPKLDSDLSDGTVYVYMDPKNQEWTYFAGITTEKSAIGYTVSQMYTTSKTCNESIMWMVYNDEPTNGPVSSSKGHSKGIVIADKSSGLWLVHSVPLFPQLPNQNNSYTYPDTGVKNGQSFLCISMTAAELDKVGNQIIKNEVMIYGSHFGGNLNSTYLGLYNATLPHKMPKEKNDEPRLETLLSIEGVEFLSISKSRHYGKDLYEDFITQEAKSNLYTETWLNSRDKLKSACSGQYKIMNIVSLTMKKIKGLNNVLFNSSLDHSKWAITEESSVHWTCIGDINRAEHQGERGGGTVCIKLKPVWTQYQQLVSSVEEC